MSFNIVGVGPGDPELLTIKAVRLIKESDVIITPVKKEGVTDSTALSIASTYIEDKNRVVYMYFPMDKGFLTDKSVHDLYKEHAETINTMLEKNLNIVCLTLGDPSIYSTFSYLAPYINSIGFVPGITSFLHGAALAKLPLCIGEESLCIVNMTDSEDDIREIFRLHQNIVVMKVCANQALLKELLIKHNKSVNLMSNIGLEKESFTTDIDVLDRKLPYFTIGIIK